MEQTTVAPRFIQRIGDKDFIRFEGLLDLGHRQGLKDVQTELIQAPGEDNGHMAIVTARITVEKGTFSGIGDATPSNVNGRIAPHIVRMAETRAVARALRLACNIGMTSAEELGDMDREGQPERQRQQPRAAERRPAPPENRAGQESAGEPPTEEQRAEFCKLIDWAVGSGRLPAEQGQGLIEWAGSPEASRQEIGRRIEGWQQTKTRAGE